MKTVLEGFRVLLYRHSKVPIDFLQPTFNLKFATSPIVSDRVMKTEMLPNRRRNVRYISGLLLPVLELVGDAFLAGCRVLGQDLFEWGFLKLRGPFGQVLFIFQPRLPVFPLGLVQSRKTLNLDIRLRRKYPCAHLLLIVLAFFNFPLFNPLMFRDEHLLLSLGCFHLHHLLELGLLINVDGRERNAWLWLKCRFGLGLASHRSFHDRLCNSQRFILFCLGSLLKLMLEILLCLPFRG